MTEVLVLALVTVVAALLVIHVRKQRRRDLRRQIRKRHFEERQRWDEMIKSKY